MPNARDISLGLTQERLRSLLSYDQETGEFRWLRPETFKASVLIGTVAGHLHAATGYRRICIGKRLYRANRLAWLYVTGVWPVADVDHINGNRGDDSWCNLRAATNSQNAANCGKRCTNTTGFKGVHFDRKRQKWRASLTVNYKQFFLGHFASAEEASLAYQAASVLAFGQFAESSQLVKEQ